MPTAIVIALPAATSIWLSLMNTPALPAVPCATSMVKLLPFGPFAAMVPWLMKVPRAVSAVAPAAVWPCTRVSTRVVPSRVGTDPPVPALPSNVSAAVPAVPAISIVLPTRTVPTGTTTVPSCTIAVSPGCGTPVVPDCVQLFGLSNEPVPGIPQSQMPDETLVPMTVPQQRSETRLQ